MTETQTTPIKDSYFWDERYRTHKTVYGEHPNAFFKEQLLKLQPGKLLLPAEGEGRNAIFAAKQGWDVDAFDYSEAAKEKALSEAVENNVKIYYATEDIRLVTLPTDTYDAVALIYVHLEPELRKKFHLQTVQALKPGGHLILEAFSKDQITNISGGPKDQTLLYSLDELAEDFKSLRLSVFRSENVRLNEGPFHQGKASVIRIAATKFL